MTKFSYFDSAFLILAKKGPGIDILGSDYGWKEGHNDDDHDDTDMNGDDHDDELLR